MQHTESPTTNILYNDTAWTRAILDEPNRSGVSLDLISAESGASHVGVSDVLYYSSRS